MKYYTYSKINRQCVPQTTALVSNHKFMTDDIRDINMYPLDPYSRSIEVLDEAPKTCNAEDSKQIWGNSLWTYMHYAAMNYPERPAGETINEMVNWLSTLATTIPCKNCSNHYRGYIEESKPQLPSICSTRDSLFKFLVDLHNKVNQRLGKPKVTLEEAQQMYQSDGSCTTCNL